MGVTLTQAFVRMRREIHDQQPSSRAQGARRLADRPRRLVEVMQNLVDDREIVGAALDRQRIEVPLTKLHVAQAGALEARAGDAQHLRRPVDADGAPGDGRQHFEHASGPGAEIEEILDRHPTDGVANRRLHALLGHMHGAHLIPDDGLRREIARGAVRAHLPDLGEARTVGGGQRVVAGQPADDVAAELRRRRALRGQKERPGALAMAIDEAGLDEQLQMTRDARLRLAEDHDQLAYRQLGLDEQREKAQARAFAGGGEGG